MIQFRKQISNTGINTELSSSVDGDRAQLRRLCTLSVLTAATGLLLSEARVDGVLCHMRAVLGPEVERYCRSLAILEEQKSETHRHNWDTSALTFLSVPTVLWAEVHIFATD